MFLLMQIENNNLGNLVAGQESINAPAGSLFIRGIQVYTILQDQRLQELIDGWKKKIIHTYKNIKM